MQELNIRTLYEYNLSTWFLLPATGYRKTDFDPYGFINTFVADDFSYVYVRTAIPVWAFSPNGTIVTETPEGNPILCIPVNPIHKADFQLYREGKFSMFSDRFKGLILRGSSLPFRIDFNTNESEMDLRIAALLSEHRHALEEALAEAIYSEEDRENGLEVLKSNLELLRKPLDSEFIQVL
jgi:hypothetical protein